MELTKKYIFQQVSKGKLEKQAAKKMLLELSEGKSRKMEIAVVGMAGRYPKCENVEDYWNLLKDGKCAISTYPQDRKEDVIGLNDRNNKNASREDVYGGYFDEIDKFDAENFRISAKEATAMDPFQRILLETAWKTLEDAGYSKEKINGTRTGVYIGRDHASGNAYRKLNVLSDMVVTGNFTSILASRISYVFNLSGPSFVIDTACSSSLVAIHEACEAIKRNECSMALAGGINIIYELNNSLITHIEANDNLIKAFSKDASGTIWSEAAGLILLKPLKKAIEDGDKIYGILKGGMVNNDGLSNGITAPSPEAQADVIINAWKNAGVHPETISYIEAHGTGTVIGDPIEISGLTAAFGKYTKRKQFCALGSVKTNIGHSVGASGVSSVIKVLLAMKHKQIPASLFFEEPNPFISFTNSPIYINDQLRNWETGDMPRRAGVSCFGFNGTNCHLILEEYTKPAEREERKPLRKEYLFVVSGKDEQSLQTEIADYCQYIIEHEELFLPYFCYSASAGKNHFPYRLAVICKDRMDLLQKLKNCLKKDFVSENREEGVYYLGHYNLVTSLNVSKSEYDILEREKRQLDKEANEFFEQYEPTDDSERLKKCAEFYIKGAFLDWEKCFDASERKKTGVPEYQLDRKRYWPEKETEKKNQRGVYYGKPLVQWLQLKTVLCHSYYSVFNVKDDWIFKEHVLLEHHVCPGTAFLEMALEAYADENKGQKVMELTNCLFENPLWIEEKSEKQVTIELVKKENSHAYVISGRAEKEDEWVIYAEGQITSRNVQNIQNYEIEEILNRCNRKTVELVNPSQGEISLGERWDIFSSIHIGNEEAIAHVALPKKFTEEMKQYILHPSVMDSAGVVACRLMGDDFYLPTGYQRITVYQPLTEEVYCYVKCVENDGEESKFNLWFINPSGEVLVKAEGYTMTRIVAEDMLSAYEEEEPDKDVNNYLKDVVLTGREGEGYTETEKVLACIWSETLGIKTVDIYKKLYDLGGDSLIIMKLASLIEDVMKIEVNRAVIIEKETLFEIAQFIDEEKAMEEEKKKQDSQQDKKKEKENFESEQILDLKVIDQIHPFNDIFYRDCAYNILFPALTHFGVCTKGFLANDVNYFAKENEKWTSLDVKIDSIVGIEELLVSNGMKVKIQNKTDDVLKSLMTSIGKGRPVMLRVDCFYEKMRKDTYHKVHLFHFHLVYGYDKKEKIFHIIEHENMDSIEYSKKTISFEEEETCYRGYMTNFNTEEQYPSYYELGYTESKTKQEDDTDYGQVFLANMKERKNMLLDGIELLEDFITGVQSVDIEAKNAEKTINELYLNVNNIINMKRAELYKVRTLLENRTDLEKILEDLCAKWKQFRVSILKLQYSKQIHPTIIPKMIDCLKKIKQLELDYVQQIEAREI